MERLRLIIEEVSRETPFVDFDFKRGVLLLKGHSMVSDPVEFYEPIIQKLKEYLATSPKFIFEMRLTYFNTASSKKLMDIISLFPKKTIVKWFHYEEDDDMIDAGQEFYAIFDGDIEFEFIPIIEGNGILNS